MKERWRPAGQRHLTDRSLKALKGEVVTIFDSAYRACSRGAIRVRPNLSDVTEADAKAFRKGGRTAIPTCPKCAVLWDENCGTPPASSPRNDISGSGDAPSEG